MKFGMTLILAAIVSGLSGTTATAQCFYYSQPPSSYGTPVVIAPGEHRVLLNHGTIRSKFYVRACFKAHNYSTNIPVINGRLPNVAFTRYSNGATKLYCDYGRGVNYNKSKHCNGSGVVVYDENNRSRPRPARTQPAPKIHPAPRPTVKENRAPSKPANQGWRPAAPRVEDSDDRLKFREPVKPIPKPVAPKIDLPGSTFDASSKTKTPSSSELAGSKFRRTLPRHAPYEEPKVERVIPKIEDLPKPKIEDLPKPKAPKSGDSPKPPAVKPESPNLQDTLQRINDRLNSIEKKVSGIDDLNRRVVDLESRIGPNRTIAKPIVPEKPVELLSGMKRPSEITTPEPSHTRSFPTYEKK